MKIAIVKLSALGDIIHGMVVLQLIKKHRPEVVIDWVVETRFKGVLEHNPHINQIHTVELQSAKRERSIVKLFKEFRKVSNAGPYDLVIDLQGLVKSALIAKLIPSQITLGFDQKSLRENFAAKFYNKTFQMDYAENVIDRNVALVGHGLGLFFDKSDIIEKRPFLFSYQQFTFKCLSRTKKNIVLIPGASFPSKCYPIDKLAQFTKKLSANYLVVWGSRSEKVMAEEIKQLGSAVTVMKTLSLSELISLIAQVDLVIGSDTGPTHTAWALNISSITLFGPTPGYRNTYATTRNKVVESESEVNPYKINRNDFSIKNINVGDIVKIAQNLLK